MYWLDIKSLVQNYFLSKQKRLLIVFLSLCHYCDYWTKSDFFLLCRKSINCNNFWKWFFLWWSYYHSMCGSIQKFIRYFLNLLLFSCWCITQFLLYQSSKSTFLNLLSLPPASQASNYDSHLQSMFFASFRFSCIIILYPGANLV